MTRVWGGLAGVLIRYLDEHALDLAELRKVLGQYGPGQRMPIRIWFGALEQISAKQRMAAVGLRIGESIDFHHLGVLGYLFSTSRTVGEALLCFQHFQPLLHDASPLFIRHQDGEVKVTWNTTPGEGVQVSDEVLLACLLSFSRRMTCCDNLVFSRVGFPSPSRGDAEVYEALLGCEVEFASNQLFACFASELLARPLSGADPELFRLLNSQLEETLVALPAVDDFLGRLKKQITELLRDGRCSAAELALQIGMNERELYRRLEERGLNYRLLLDDVRFHLAQRYLDEGKLALVEIAMALGYSEQSAFTRAFKRWSGQPPFRYRLRR
ncbi:AraC family transcriptional regulator ligand-binding domain-containing protein [Pseudomonas aeruginosa]|uniref:AraC family transcriptional regulator ligand-binding domain-containing protein n=1 Tax=Pseudomonas aeruginosa TaxID=287 RepID=UPI003F3D12D8